MNFYYDILVNLQPNFIEFYEWEKEDNIWPIKKVPLFRVKHSVIVDFLSYDIVFRKEFLNDIFEKTIVKNDKNRYTSFLVTDCKSTLFFDIDSDGNVKYRSKLLVEDENNINEIASSLKVTDFSYQLKSKLIVKSELRKTMLEKIKISKALIDLARNENIPKINYLYYEWFHEVSNDYVDSLKKMNDCLDKEEPMVIHKICHLLDLSSGEKL